VFEVSTIDGASAMIIPLGQVTSKFSLSSCGCPILRRVLRRVDGVDLLSMPEVYILPIPAHLRLAVENLSQLVTNGDESRQSRDEALAAAE
jgi:hypothetical protein